MILGMGIGVVVVFSRECSVFSGGLDGTMEGENLFGVLKSYQPETIYRLIFLLRICHVVLGVVQCINFVGLYIYFWPEQGKYPRMHMHMHMHARVLNLIVHLVTESSTES